MSEMRKREVADAATNEADAVNTRLYAPEEASAPKRTRLAVARPTPAERHDDR